MQEPLAAVSSSINQSQNRAKLRGAQARAVPQQVLRSSQLDFKRAWVSP